MTDSISPGRRWEVEEKFDGALHGEMEDYQLPEVGEENVTLLGSESSPARPALPSFFIPRPPTGHAQHIQPWEIEQRPPDSTHGSHVHHGKRMFNRPRGPSPHTEAKRLFPLASTLLEGQGAAAGGGNGTHAAGTLGIFPIKSGGACSASPTSSDSSVCSSRSCGETTPALEGLVSSSPQKRTRTLTSHHRRRRHGRTFLFVFTGLSVAIIVLLSLVAVLYISLHRHARSTRLGNVLAIIEGADYIPVVNSLHSESSDFSRRAGRALVEVEGGEEDGLVRARAGEALLPARRGPATEGGEQGGREEGLEDGGEVTEEGATEAGSVRDLVPTMGHSLITSQSASKGSVKLAAAKEESGEEGGREEGEGGKRGGRGEESEGADEGDILDEEVEFRMGKRRSFHPLPPPAKMCSATYKMNLSEEQAQLIDLDNFDQELLGTIMVRLCNCGCAQDGETDPPAPSFSSRPHPIAPPPPPRVDSLTLMSEILRGAHVVIENDRGAFYSWFVRMQDSYRRTSSHLSTVPMYGIDQGSVLRTILTGRTGDGDTWMQFEGAGWDPFRRPFESFLHALNFVQYRITGRQVGPLGTSAFTDQRPVQLHFDGCTSDGPDILGRLFRQLDAEDPAGKGPIPTLAGLVDRVGRQGRHLMASLAPFSPVSTFRWTLRETDVASTGLGGAAGGGSGGRGRGGGDRNLRRVNRHFSYE